MGSSTLSTSPPVVLRVSEPSAVQKLESNCDDHHPFLALRCCGKACSKTTHQPWESNWWSFTSKREGEKQIFCLPMGFILFTNAASDSFVCVLGWSTGKLWSLRVGCARFGEGMYSSLLRGVEFLLFRNLVVF